MLCELFAPQVDDVKSSLSNDEQKVGAEIVRRSLGYPLKLIANNAGVNGSVVQQKVLESADPNVGYNASTGKQTVLTTSCYLWSAIVEITPCPAQPQEFCVKRQLHQKWKQNHMLVWHLLSFLVLCSEPYMTMCCRGL